MLKTIANLVTKLIFIFSTHVFDVGDLVMIDEQYLVVKEFGLFSTVFRRVDGQEIIVPNSLLSSTKLVHNMRRSTSMYVVSNFCQHARDSLSAGGRVRLSRYRMIPRWKSSNS